VPVPVMQVGEMGVAVTDRLVAMRMRMRLRAFVALVHMLVVLVMDVAVVVLHRLVDVLVVMPFA
jgi:hypothetical protein